MKILDDMTNLELCIQSTDHQLTLPVFSKCKNLWSYSLAKRSESKPSVDPLAIGHTILKDNLLT